MSIVVAVDRSNRAEEAVREAESLAAAFDETLHVVHVLTRSEFLDLGLSSVDRGDSIEMGHVREAAEEIAADATDDLEVSFETVGLMGDPATRIVEYATEQDAQYIVVATRKRSPTGKAIFGSVAQSILLNAECPVLVTLSQ